MAESFIRELIRVGLVGDTVLWWVMGIRFCEGVGGIW